jgi:mannose-6-phosphate isomerase-like protein (cupin superfamily)
VKRVELPSRRIEHFGSVDFMDSRVARGETWQVSLVTLDGVIGGHDAASRQLLIVLSGRVVCSTRDTWEDLGVGEAVEWQEGEWHETRSLEESRLLIVEGVWERAKPRTCSAKSTCGATGRPAARLACGVR